jgi:hypothetical protein
VGSKGSSIPRVHINGSLASKETRKNNENIYSMMMCNMFEDDTIDVNGFVYLEMLVCLCLIVKANVYHTPKLMNLYFHLCRRG